MSLSLTVQFLLSAVTSSVFTNPSTSRQPEVLDSPRDVIMFFFLFFSDVKIIVV